MKHHPVRMVTARCMVTARSSTDRSTIISIYRRDYGRRSYKVGNMTNASYHRLIAVLATMRPVIEIDDGYIAVQYYPY